MDHNQGLPGEGFWFCYIFPSSLFNKSPEYFYSVIKLLFRFMNEPSQCNRLCLFIIRLIIQSLLFLERRPVNPLLARMNIEISHCLQWNLRFENKQIIVLNDLCTLLILLKSLVRAQSLVETKYNLLLRDQSCALELVDLQNFRHGFCLKGVFIIFRTIVFNFSRKKFQFWHLKIKKRQRKNLFPHFPAHTYYIFDSSFLLLLLENQINFVD